MNETPKQISMRIQKFLESITSMGEYVTGPNTELESYGLLEDCLDVLKKFDMDYIAEKFNLDCGDQYCFFAGNLPNRKMNSGCLCWVASTDRQLEYNNRLQKAILFLLGSVNETNT